MKLKTALYILVIILLNIASTTLFFRIDLTENKSYSLSQGSKNLVANLEEPLTIKVFLSQNLPVPYNTLERDIRDILMEYKLKANRHFNYTIDLIDKEKENSVKPETYNIYPVNIQNIEQDEVKVVSAYIGMAFIHGDLIETIPAIQYNENLELIITKNIRKLTEKTTSLLSMKNNIKTTLYISPIMYKVSSNIKNYNNSVSNFIDSVGSEYFNRLDYDFVEVNERDIPKLEKDYGITTLNLTDQNDNTTKAVASVIITSDQGSSNIDLIVNDIFGRTTLLDDEQLSNEISSRIDKMIGVKTKIGYLTSNGTIPMNQNQMLAFSGQQEPTINNLTSIINENYSFAAVDLKEGFINNDIKTLIIAKPTEKFSERELYLLDQYLLKGNSLLLALDQVTMDMENSNPNYGIEKYMPLDHGLYELLKNYGISLNQNMVMDMNSFKQIQRDQKGSIQETQIYFAPMVQHQNINQDLDVLKGSSELITFRMTEVKALDREDSTVKTLFTTSDKGWTVEPDKLTLIPAMISPSGEMSKISLGVLKDGNFTSFFKGKEIPAKELKEKEEEDEGTESNLISGVTEDEALIESSEKGKLMVLGSSDMITDSILSQNYQSNVLFMQNSIDYLSGREDYTQMRSKGVLNRPMVEVSTIKRNFIKYFNIIGLPIIVALCGLLSYLIWLNKKNRIKQLFMESTNEK